ncbi:beta-glucosidase [Tangfeifania diversioriginum]|uniref:beta-N-acetylhexosaminidase n=1 Tax=Tangfeifania diversioriginum TaxID=1168035 RepID=A0A1M6JUI8_9BACT|nr:glycoside hydrolase family 3 N-terminal domain-containing protein [Tangfeifania diversioriginum]SHJ50404.1 beta-glucosidase [Tangfeifania diversioriginum]
MRIRILLLFIVFFTGIHSLKAADPPFLQLVNDHWVNEKLEAMTLDEKIAQLMMVTVYPRQDELARGQMEQLISQNQPGGILVMQGDLVKTARWINHFQEKATVPLLVAVDGEWGLSMRIDSTVKYPYAQALGAVQDSTFIKQMGRDFGYQMREMGIHMNFAPVADVSTNPQNPVINFRSFGEDKIDVSQKAWYVASGMQEAGVVPVAKHFPGHGDTHTDSHKELPVVDHPKTRIDEIESFPFRYLTERGISGIMTAHLDVPALDNSGTPSSLSEKIVDGYLRDEIGYSGLVVTDAINMKGVQTGKGNAELEALKAGNDMVEFVPDIEKAISSVKLAVAKGEITLDEINLKCRRVLALKRWAGLHISEPVNTKGLTSRLNSPYYEVTNRKLIKGALTVLVNNDRLPVQDLGNQKIATVMIGASAKSSFQKMVDKYVKADHFTLSKSDPERELVSLRSELDNYDLVIVGIQGVNIFPSGAYGTTRIQRNAVAELVRENKTITVFFGNAYALKHFENIHQSGGLILAYQNNLLTQQLAAQLVFGAFNATGRLPVTVDNRFKLKDGISMPKNKSLAFSIPEEVGINSALLRRKIDSIARLGIDSKAFPGCQVLIAKEGNVIFHECYGFHTYKKEQKVEPSNIYDWASITKVTGPLPPIMKLRDEGKINLDEAFSHYWPDFQGTNKDGISFREILAHQARLASWIAYWQMALDDDGTLSGEVFKSHPTEEFDVRVSDHLYMNRNFRKTMFDTIRTSKLLPRKRYVYSGLSFYLFPDMISNLTGEHYETYLKTNFFDPLGAYSVTYNPYLHFPLNRIVPTENDDFFRNEKLRGFVHDEGAAMMGGISGNAGLFGTTTDLAKIFQMYLQKGYYGGKRFISEETVNEFTRVQYPENDNRRGLGFDKPYIDNHKKKLKNAYPAVDASKNSFGHSGYTGTFAWADPDNELLFLFMSNRVHPTRNNAELFNLNIRPAMHQAIYDCLDNN